MTLNFEQQRIWAGVDGSFPEVGQNVIVGICDSGIIDNHPLIQGKVLTHHNFTFETEIDHFHGTMVAGCVANIAPGVLFIDCKVLDNDGHGQLDWAMAGAEQAVADGAKIINFSLATNVNSCWENHAMAEFLDVLDSNGITVIAAAGNNGLVGGVLPAAARKATAVGALDEVPPMSRAPYSNEGPSCNHYYPDVAATGTNIWVILPDGGEAPASGTSFASPIVAGVFALAAENLGYPGTMSFQNRELVLESTCVRNLGDPVGKDNSLGWGVIHAGNMINFLNTGELPDDCPPGFHWDTELQECVINDPPPQNTGSPIKVFVAGLALAGLVAMMAAKK